MTPSPLLGPHAAAPPSRAPGGEGDTGTPGRAGTGHRTGLALDTSLVAQYGLARSTTIGWHWAPVWTLQEWHWEPVRAGTGQWCGLILGTSLGRKWAPVQGTSKDRSIAQLPRAPGCHTGLGPAQGGHSWEGENGVWGHPRQCCTPPAQPGPQGAAN